MSCILRVSGRRFDVDRYLKRTPFVPVKVYRRGEPKFPGVVKHRVRHRLSGCNIVVSARERTEYRSQIRDTIRFLKRHVSALRRLRSSAGVEWAVLDFGVEWRPHAVAQFSHVPEELVALAAKARLSLEISMYPPSVPATITRTGEGRRTSHAAPRRTRAR